MDHQDKAVYQDFLGIVVYQVLVGKMAHKANQVIQEFLDIVDIVAKLAHQAYLDLVEFQDKMAHQVLAAILVIAVFQVKMEAMAHLDLVDLADILEQ